MKVAIRGIYRQQWERENKWEKQVGNQENLTHEEIVKGGISSKCLYKEILNQTVENTNKCLNKEKITVKTRELW